LEWNPETKDRGTNISFWRHNLGTINKPLISVMPTEITALSRFATVKPSESTYCTTGKEYYFDKFSIQPLSAVFGSQFDLSGQIGEEYIPEWCE
jgi:hypothetical protein